MFRLSTVEKVRLSYCLKKMAQIAVQKDCGKFEWSCLDWNKPSRDFYEAIGAQSQDEWVGYRMSGKVFIDFAAQGD
jgi:RimJ/RimL family protein N-acetyltransferase